MDIEWRDGTAVVHLGGDLNAFDAGFVADLHDALDAVAGDDRARSLVTVGRGKHYSNGFDLDFLGSLDRPARAAFMRRAQGALARLLTFRVPTVAAVNGHAFGIGAMLALAHDRRAMRRDRGWFCLPEIDLRMQFQDFMLALITHRLPRPTLEEAVLTGRRYGGDDAVAAGIVHTAVAADALVAAAIELAEPMTGKAPDVTAGLKRALHAPVLAHLDVAGA
jgi:enoyl-CoA hydratase/carnithine racemase